MRESYRLQLFPLDSDKSDFDNFNVLMKSIIDCTSAISAFRFPKSLDNKPRPLKVTFDDESVALSVLRNASTFAKKNITVKNDLTLNQRQYHESVRADLNKRISEGESNLTIRYVDNIPKIVPQPKNA